MVSGNRNPANDAIRQRRVKNMRDPLTPNESNSATIGKRMVPTRANMEGNLRPKVELTRTVAKELKERHRVDRDHNQTLDVT